MTDKLNWMLVERGLTYLDSVFVYFLGRDS
jgi:hypothetical protein